MNLGSVAQRVRAGETIRFRAVGQSMRPHIRSGEMVTVEPVQPIADVKGRVVLAKVRGRWYLHFAKTIRGEQVQIANARGHVNGWTSRENVVGVVRR